MIRPKKHGKNYTKDCQCNALDGLLNLALEAAAAEAAVTRAWVLNAQFTQAEVQNTVISIPQEGRLLRALHKEAQRLKKEHDIIQKLRWVC